MSLLGRIFRRDQTTVATVSQQTTSEIAPEQEGVPLGLKGAPLMTVTEAAREQVRRIVQTLDPAVDTIRLTAQGRGRYSMSVEPTGRPGLDDTVLPYQGFRLLIDPLSLPHLEGATMDWRETFGGGGFDFTPPPAHRQSRQARVAPPEGPDGEVWRQISAALDEEVNPQVASHGGYIDLIDVRGSTAYVEMGGGCQGCSMSKATLKQGVEKAIFRRVPQITSVLDVTDHAGGTNPYYKG